MYRDLCMRAGSEVVVVGPPLRGGGAIYWVGENSVGDKMRQCMSLISGTVYATHSSQPGERHAASRFSLRSCRDL